LGNGDGTFGAAASSPATGNNPAGLSSGDFNNDGIADLAVINGNNNGTGTLTILLGNGDGTFTASPTSPTVGDGATLVITADFNHDGRADLAITDQQSGSLTILLGNGDGSFEAAASPAVTSYAQALASGDFNGDGIPDLIVGCSNFGLVFVLLGNGDGTFTAGPAFPSTTIEPAALSIADFDEDGIADVAILDNSSSGGAHVFLGHGDGTFTASTAIAPEGYFPTLLVTADFNGDGRADVVVTGNDASIIQTDLTEPTETASATANVTLTGVGQHLVDASYAGDSNYTSSLSGTTSLWGVLPATATTLTMTSRGAPVTSVAPGTTITLTALVEIGARPVTSGQVDFCDASVNECSDIHLVGTGALNSSGEATYNFVPGPGTHSYKAVFVEDGYGQASSSAALSLSVGPAPAAVYSDAAAISASGGPGNYSLTATVTGYGGSAVPTGTVSFLDTSFGNTSLGTAALQSGAAGLGWLVSQTALTTQDPTFQLTGDFNGDGIPDLAVLGTDNIYSDPPFSITILFGKGDGTFTTGPSTQLPSSTPVVDILAGDFNDDDKEDIVLLTDFLYPAGPTVISLLGRGDGTFAISTASTVALPTQGGGDVIQPSMVSADFNGDGKPDLGIVGNYIYGGVSILLGNGDGTFTATATNPEASRGLGMIAAGDFNGDHIPDLVVSDYFNASSTTVLLGKGDGTFTATDASLSTDTFTQSAVVGDFNGDGKADIAIGLGGSVAVYLGEGDGSFTQPAGSPFSGPGVGLRIGDFNHDGKLDLAGVNSYAQTVGVLLGAGDGTFTSASTSFRGTLPSSTPVGLVSADFNLDGVPDLSFVNRLVSTGSILLTEPTETVTATLTNVAPVGAGTHNVEASYPGDQNYPSAVSGTVALTAGLKPLTITPAGGTFSSTQTVAITEAIPGATIYYSASGVLNTNGFVPYTGPIALSIGGSETITAYATETGYDQSSYTTVNFLLNLPVAPTPVISPTGGVFAGMQTVTITDTASAAAIYYTTDGTQPSANSAVYSGSIQVSSSGTIAAIAGGNGYSLSPATTAQFFIQSSQSRYIYTVAGSGFWGFGGDGGPAPMAVLNDPTNTAVDSAGNLYIADAGNQLVRRVDASTGIISTVAGTGTAGYSGDGGAATKADLNYPYAVAFDSQGNLYISDSGNYAIRRVDAVKGTISTVAGTGTSGTSGDGGAATKAMLGYPEGIALDTAGNLYICDGLRVRMVNAKTGVINTVAGNGTYGFSGDGGPATSASLTVIEGIAVDKSENLYLADTSNQVIRKVTAATGIITTVAGRGGSGPIYTGYSGDGGPATSAKLDDPTGVAVDAAGNLYIADTQNYVLREVTAADGKINTIAGHFGDCSTLAGDGGPANQAGLCYAPGVTLDGEGNVYVAEEGYNRIRKIIPASVPPSNATAQPAFSVAAGSYTAPQTLTIRDTTPGAEIYVSINGSQARPVGQGYSGPIAITGSATVQAVAVAPGYLPSTPTSAAYTITPPPAAIIRTFAGNGTTIPVGIGGPATSAGIASPNGIAFDGSNNLYIADPNNATVWEVSGTTGEISVAAGIPGVFYSPRPPGQAASTALYNPQQIAVDTAGNLYIADTGFQEVLKVDAKTGMMTIFAGGGNPAPPSIGDGGPATQANIYPNGLAFDQAGNLYISDAFNNRIRKVSLTSGIITTVAGGGTAGRGDGAAATAATLDFPGPIVLDGKGNLYFGEQDGRVRVVDGKTGIITTFAGSGIAGATGDGGPALAAQLFASGLAVDSSDNLYISNEQDGIRMVPAGGGTITRVVGNGYSGFEGDGGAATMAELCDPDGLAFDKAGSLYIADSCNARVREVTSGAATSTPAFSPAAGTYQGTQTVTITDATPGAVIYYTTDGSTPTTSSTLYSAPIIVSASETLKAIAATTDNAASAVASATYVITQPIVPDVSAVKSSMNPSMAGDSVTFTVSVSSSAGTPSGNVTFMDGSAQLGSATLTGGSATYTPSTLATGSHSITAVYSGDDTFASVTSSVLTQVVESFSITTPGSSSTTATASPGGQATYALTVTPPAAGDALTFSVTGLPAGATSTFSPSTIAPGASATNVTLTISIPANTAVQPMARPLERRPWPVALALMLAPFALRNRKRWRASLSLFLLVATGLILSFGVTACGGSGKQTSPSQQTYNLTVTATSGTLTQSTNLTLLVQ